MQKEDNEYKLFSSVLSDNIETEIGRDTVHEKNIESINEEMTATMIDKKIMDAPLIEQT